jgi:hypothetical protein
MIPTLKQDTKAGGVQVQGPAQAYISRQGVRKKERNKKILKENLC